jgi:glycosyltransferase involved in cell wall biosynthesis
VSGDTSRTPRVVVVVGNGISEDSRVQKSALAAARAGWEVVLLGRSARAREESWLGSVRVVRIPLRRTLHDRFEAAARRAGDPVIDEVRVPGNARVSLSWRGSHIGRFAHRLLRRARAAVGRVERRLMTDMASAPRSVESPVLPTTPPYEVSWRRDWPILSDWDLSFRPEIVALEPDLIHANDALMLGVAARSAAQLRLAGRAVSWIYDSHEYVPDVDWGGPTVSAAYRQYEREFIHRADAVVTVSPSIAVKLEREYSLREKPEVVANVPVRFVGADGRSVRAVTGVPEGAPLLVYSGYLTPERGLHTAVQALVFVPGVHLALVTSPHNPLLHVLRDSAEQLGVDDRLHVAPYVPPFAVPDYLSTADLGLVASLHSPNYEESLPTKFAEYLHAGLPLVVSDLRTVSAFVRQNSVGEVFEAGSAIALAEAVARALDRRDELAAGITDELLDDLSWERQAAILLGTYSRVSGLLPVPPSNPVPWSVEESADPVGGTETVR